MGGPDIAIANLSGGSVSITQPSKNTAREAIADVLTNGTITQVDIAAAYVTTGM
jgi:hypothetical protein